MVVLLSHLLGLAIDRHCLEAHLFALSEEMDMLAINEDI